MPKIQTLSEREQDIERVAIARCICRTGKYPGAKEVRDELQALRSAEIRGEAVYPRVKESDAMGFLMECGLPAPKRESTQTGTRTLPGTVPVPKTNMPDNGKLDNLKRK